MLKASVVQRLFAVRRIPCPPMKPPSNPPNSTCWPVGHVAVDDPNPNAVHGPGMSFPDTGTLTTCVRRDTNADTGLASTTHARTATRRSADSGVPTDTDQPRTCTQGRSDRRDRKWRFRRVDDAVVEQQAPSPALKSYGGPVNRRASLALVTLTIAAFVVFLVRRRSRRRLRLDGKPRVISVDLRDGSTADVEVDVGRHPADRIVYRSAACTSSHLASAATNS